MTDAQSPRRAQADAARAETMDQALTWLIELDIADAETHRRFLEWLDADPSHHEIFASAEAVWHSQPVFDAAALLAARKKT
ncbi:FecR/PupR family sigma factor regulator [Pseudomonas sp. W2Oct36]|uniref:FecR/PupR family sigma factor regulator n=1 Tax=Pseudomonas sp. W2Oct36 TaxID=1215284 RepID=UPI0034E0D873